MSVDIKDTTSGLKGKRNLEDFVPEPEIGSQNERINTKQE